MQKPLKWKKLKFLITHVEKFKMQLFQGLLENEYCCLVSTYSSAFLKFYSGLCLKMSTRFQLPIKHSTDCIHIGLLWIFDEYRAFSADIYVSMLLSPPLKVGRRFLLYTTKMGLVATSLKTWWYYYSEIWEKLQTHLYRG